jgi:hypothetical protein
MVGLPAHAGRRPPHRGAPVKNRETLETWTPAGWGLGISGGDFILMKRPDGREARYAVEAIRYYVDPPDMWSATLVFAPRPRQEAP